MSLDDPELQARMAALDVREADLIERFILGTGSGGQKINKTASCVQLHHPPSGIEIKCQETRSREDNRRLARLRLCEELESRRKTARLERDRRRALQRARHRKPSAAKVKRRIEQKRRRGDLKKLRGRPDPDNRR